jgi:DNA replication licensing factor MCM5
MNIHMNRPNSNAEVVGEIDIDKMKRYISYCKSYVAVRISSPHHPNSFKLRKCAPRLSPDAQEMLSSHFVGLRKQVQQVEQDNDERSSIPITVRSVHSHLPQLF